MKKYIYNIIRFVPFYLLLFYLITVPSSCDFESTDCDSVIYDTMKVYDTIVYNDTNRVEIIDTVQLTDTIINYQDSIIYDTTFIQVHDTITITDTIQNDSITYLMQDLYPEQNQYVYLNNGQFDVENDSLVFTYEYRNYGNYIDTLQADLYVNDQYQLTDTIVHFNFTDWYRKTWSYPDTTVNIEVKLKYKNEIIDVFTNQIKE